MLFFRFDAFTFDASLFAYFSLFAFAVFRRAAPPLIAFR